MEPHFLGSGWAFPAAPKDQKVARISGEDCVAQSIAIILGTAKGERVMRPDFGCGIHELVFEPDTAATRRQLAEEVRTALVRWEPRIAVRDVTVTVHPETPSALLIDVAYEIRATQSQFNLVYPFYLQQGGR